MALLALVFDGGEGCRAHLSHLLLYLPHCCPPKRLQSISVIPECTSEDIGVGADRNGSRDAHGTERPQPNKVLGMISHHLQSKANEGAARRLCMNSSNVCWAVSYAGAIAFLCSKRTPYIRICFVLTVFNSTDGMMLPAPGTCLVYSERGAAHADEGATAVLARHACSKQYTCIFLPNAAPHVLCLFRGGWFILPQAGRCGPCSRHPLPACASPRSEIPKD